MATTNADQSAATIPAEWMREPVVVRTDGSPTGLVNRHRRAFSTPLRQQPQERESS